MSTTRLGSLLPTTDYETDTESSDRETASIISLLFITYMTTGEYGER
jgi:hypothetical protein